MVDTLKNKYIKFSTKRKLRRDLNKLKKLGNIDIDNDILIIMKVLDKA